MSHDAVQLVEVGVCSLLLLTQVLAGVCFKSAIGVHQLHLPVDFAAEQGQTLCQHGAPHLILLPFGWNCIEYILVK